MAKYKIRTIKVGECEVAKPLVYYLEGWEEETLLCYYFWLVEGEGRKILVDTGFTLDLAHRFMPEMRQKEGEDTISQLKKLGVDPAEIELIIATHAHFDHLSTTFLEFENAKLILQKEEYDYTVNPPHPWFSKFSIPELLAKLSDEGRLILVEGEEEIVEGVRVFRTGCHTPGHQSVEVETERGKVVICGDAVFTFRNIEEDIPIGLFSCIEECFRCMEDIRRRGGIPVPGHDPELITRLGEVIG
ncbi:N-acyl homoserine lactonase family protein [Candidatus Poribacteria bacterium]|nr:N-acyl homoserine lactonase family protein [Candidatus Poribacteria bacterium]